MMTAEDRAALTAACEQAWSSTSSVAVAGIELHRLVESAISHGEAWAKAVHHEAIQRGYATIARRNRRPALATPKGAIAGAAGVIGTGGWVQLSLLDLTPRQVLQAIRVREGQRKAASRNLWALRKLAALCARQPNALTVEDALTAEGVTLEQLLEATS